MSSISRQSAACLVFACPQLFPDDSAVTGHGVHFESRQCQRNFSVLVSLRHVSYGPSLSSCSMNSSLTHFIVSKRHTPSPQARVMLAALGWNLGAAFPRRAIPCLMDCRASEEPWSGYINPFAPLGFYVLMVID